MAQLTFTAAYMWFVQLRLDVVSIISRFAIRRLFQAGRSLNATPAQSPVRYVQFFMMNRHILMILIAASFSSQVDAQWDKWDLLESPRRIKFDKFISPAIVDFLPGDSGPLSVETISFANIKIEAVTPFSDTVFLPGKSLTRWHTQFYNPRMRLNSTSLTVYVDTSRPQTMKLEEYWLRPNPEKSDTGFCSGYPVYVINSTSKPKTIRLQEERLIAIKEALDSAGNWKPIQIWQWSWCGNSYNDIVLAPKYMAVGMTPRYSGSYFTSIRLRLQLTDHSIFSNVYHDWIDYKQFNLPREMKNDKGELGFNLSFLADR